MWILEACQRCINLASHRDSVHGCYGQQSCHRARDSRSVSAPLTGEVWIHSVTNKSGPRFALCPVDRPGLCSLHALPADQVRSVGGSMMPALSRDIQGGVVAAASLEVEARSADGQWKALDLVGGKPWRRC